MTKGEAQRRIDKFVAAHARAFPPRGESTYTIPFQIMRDYEDVKRLRGPGLHNVTITVTRKPAVGLLDWDVMLENNVGIRVEGEKWNALHDGSVQEISRRKAPPNRTQEYRPTKRRA